MGIEIDMDAIAYMPSSAFSPSGWSLDQIRTLLLKLGHIKPQIAYLNLTEAAPLDDGWEGCLSVPGLRAVVPRYLHIHYSGFSPDGQAISEYASVFHARVVQHECDHLWGKLYPMRVKDFTQFGYTEVLFPELSTTA